MMKTVRIYLSLYLILSTIVLVNAFETIATAVIVGGVVAKLAHYTWNLFEHCDSNWISFNATGLKHDLDSKLFGQHIASRVVLNAVTEFMSDENPKKPLVLFLHGPTGTGKNFVSQMIVDNIYKLRTDSKYVHVFQSHLQFQSGDRFASFKSQVELWLKNRASICGRSLFVFDESDKIHPGLMDSIIPYLSEVSHREAIFIFLSNTGGESIKETALGFWRDGRDREEITQKDLEASVSLSAFNMDDSGFLHSSLIDKKLVDFVVPFLPLERRHVIQCVFAEMKARGLQPDQTVADQLADELNFTPKNERVYSFAGCKKINRRLDNYT